MERAQWLSEGVEKLVFELLDRRADDKPHCDIAIVGSGYGGAVAAARLAGARPAGKDAPLDVWVLERGREFVPGAFPEQFGDLPGQLRIDSDSARESWGQGEGLFDLRLGKHVSTLLGNGLGGGSLINAGVLARPSPEVFKRGPWANVLSYDALERRFDQVTAMLGAAPLPGPAPAKLAALGALAARIDGARSERASIAVTFASGESSAGVKQEACLQCADCMTGCNHLAKNTLAMNYLPLARRRGARLFTGVTVLSVNGEDDAWALELEFTDSSLRERFGEQPPRLRARRVILAAGTYGSTAILMRSRGRGFKRISARLGERFSTNGDMIAAAVGMPTQIHASADESVPPDARRVGPTITGLIHARQRKFPVVIEELAIPAALRRVFEEVVATFGTLHDLARIDRSEHFRGPGRDPVTLDSDAIERTAVYATFGDDGAKGKMALREADRIDDGLRIEWDDVADQEVFREAMTLLEKAHGDGGMVIPNPMWRVLPKDIGGMLEGGEIGGAVFTVHPLGGCAMAASAEAGVVNALGQVFQADGGVGVHRGLVVLDGSIIPTALGTNPCLTIAALAEHAVEGLASSAEWNLSLLAGNDAPLPLLDPPRRQPARPPREATAIRLAERLRGTLTLDNRAYEAALEIEYEELRDLEQLLRAPSRVLPIRRARLNLVSQDSGDANRVQQDLTVTLAGELTLFEREATTLWRRVRAAGCAWWTNRGKRDALAWFRRKRKRVEPSVEGKKGKLGLLRKIHGWIAVASHAGERRLMHYRLGVIDVPATGGAPFPLRPGDCLHGTKVIAYVANSTPDCPWPSPWDQLTKLPLVLGREHRDSGQALGCLEVDLPYFVQLHAAQLQIARQQNQPRALADLYSLFAYIARVVGRIHIWSFRAPDYPDPYPIYAFGSAEKEAAVEAAKGVVADTVNRRRYRFPQRMDGFERAVHVFTPPSKEPVKICLTRYRSKTKPPDPALAPVLLIHGLGASGNTFTLPTVEQNLVQHLADCGFESWVLDLRTSIALAASQRKSWSFDDVAREDIPAAIRKVAELSGTKQVNVVAHCIGAAMFCMAALDGGVQGLVRAAVLSQLGPLLELPPTNRFRGYAASHLKHYFDVDELDTAANLTSGNRFLDRLLSTLPYPPGEWELHNHAVQPLTHEAYCLRSYGIYGRLFEHRNMNEATLNLLGDYLGHIKYKTYQQTIFYATMRRLTDVDGRNRYVTYDRIRNYLNFPICFLHGMQNEVFDPRTSQRSFDLLASIFWPQDLYDRWQSQPGRRGGYSLYKDGKHLRIVEIPDYGHQDCMIGKSAARDVFPNISRFLRESQIGASVAPPLVVVRPPQMGPIVGWVREVQNGAKFQARILFVPNDSRSTPVKVLTIVLKDAAPVANGLTLHDFDAQQSPRTRALDVELPGAPAEYRVVVVTVHEEQFEPEPAKQAGEPRGDDPFGEDLDRFPAMSLQHLPDAKDLPQDFVELVLATCKDLGPHREPLPTGRHANHARYATPVSTAVISREVLEAARASEPTDVLRFALASCRYAANIADREAADAAFGRLRDRLEGPPEGRPQLLFLAGDNIYADATHGIFDPTDPHDRFDQRYIEAWTAPNAREVLRRLPLYPMLDDHEVKDGFEGHGKDAERGIDAFKSFQLKLSPAFLTPKQAPAKGEYAYELSASGFDFFVADTRTGRERGRGRGSFDAKIIGDARMRRLREWLTCVSQKAPDKPKFIVSPSVVVPWSRDTARHESYALRSDAWDGFPSSLQDLLGFIADNRIQYVVFLSGDYHCSLFCEIDLKRDGQTVAQAYSIVSSGLYAPFPFANTRADALELEFEGSYAQRLRGDEKPRPGERVVQIRTLQYCERDAFAVVDVRRQGSAWRMHVEFDTGHVPSGTIRRPIVQDVLMSA